jgi:peptide chain release factor 2
MHISMPDLGDLYHISKDLHAQAADLCSRLHIDGREAKLAAVEADAEDPLLWNDTETAQQVMTEVGRRRNELAPWRRLRALADDTVVLAELAADADDTDSIAEIEANQQELRSLLARLETEALFADPFDAADALIEINAGAGGTEACDWAAMLGRMYLRWMSCPATRRA